MPIHQNERIVQKQAPTNAQAAAELRSGAQVGDALREVQHQQVTQQTEANTVATADDVGIPQL